MKPTSKHAVIDAMIVAMPDMNYELQQILGADDDHVIFATS
jgi:hypothetical protein